MWTLNIKGLKFMSLSCENLWQEDLIRQIAVKISQVYLSWLFLLAFVVSLCGVCICCNFLVSTGKTVIQKKQKKKYGCSSGNCTVKENCPINILTKNDTGNKRTMLNFYNPVLRKWNLYLKDLLLNLLLH